MTSAPQISKPVGCLVLLTLLLLGWAGSLLCSLKHFCICGHFAHDPMPASALALDLAWMGLLAVIPVMARWLRCLGRWWWLTCVVFVLPIMRLGMDRFGGFGVEWLTRYLDLN